MRVGDLDDELVIAAAGHPAPDMVTEINQPQYLGVEDIRQGTRLGCELYPLRSNRERRSLTATRDIHLEGMDGVSVYLNSATRPVDCGHLA